MSYILDALKKAEKERKQGTLPDMLTVQDIVAEKPKKSYVGVYFLAVALALNAGILIWWLGSPNTAKTNVSQTAKAENPSTARADKGSEVVPEVPAPTAPRQAGSPETKPAEINAMPVGRSAPAKPDIQSAQPREMPETPDVRNKSVGDHPASDSYIPKPVGLPVEKPKQSEGAVRPPAVPADGFAELPEENKIYKLAELPSSIRQGLPSFSVTALLYSNSPEARMARVNDRMMREGQDLAAGVRLEEITRDGLVCSYRKFRFYVGAK